jgi:two-component system cell cycle sensor histidine kinase/response regulator CckA
MSVARQLGLESFSNLDPDLLRALFDHSPDCLLLFENECILLANRACLELLGYSSGAALAGRHASAVLSPNRFCRALSQSPSRCEHPACEQLVRRATGEPIRADSQCTSFRHSNREFVLAVLRPRQRLELSRAIRDSELRFRAMFEAAAIGIAICSLDGRILESNPAVTKMLGYTREELAGMHPRELHPDDFDQDKVLLAELMRGVRDSFDLDKRYWRKDGTFFWGHLQVSAVRSADHQPAFLIAMLEDTTARLRVEEQLREAEKMEVIGRLAGGVAHDFNNLLTGILLYCDLLSAAMRPGTRLRQHVEEIRMAAEQGAALTQQLLAIARKQVPQPRPMVVNDIVSSTKTLIRRLIGEQIELLTDLRPNLGSVLADQAQMRQVLLNLVLNARDAMPQGGRITVTTRSANFPGNGQPAVALSVQDTGCGMDAATRARIFEPFFTTKEAGHGTGLGLATVRRIVDESSGAIDVQSELGRGTRIEVFFPLIAQAANTAPPPTARRGGETVLLVDDHAAARHSMQSTLLEAGFRVLQAPGGKRALKLFADHARRVDLLVADCMMPGMDGHELAEQLRRQKPGLKVLLISGYRSRRSPSVPSSVRLIHKPFSGNELIERIREVLDSTGDLPC